MTPVLDQYHYILSRFEDKKNVLRAPAMKAYMKNKFEYFGVSAPDRKVIVKEFKKNYKLDNNTEFWLFIDHLWADEHRECQYVAVDLLQLMSKKLTVENISFLEKLIVTKSWWDTVDGIAPSLTGTIFLKHPEEIPKYIYRWMDSENIWLQRSAIIFQLKYGRLTDWDLLSEAILKNDTSKAFFVRKAQGWALRQYSRFEPLKVIHFVDANPQLSGLTKKEALRLIK